MRPSSLDKLTGDATKLLVAAPWEGPERLAQCRRPSIATLLRRARYPRCSTLRQWASYRHTITISIDLTRVAKELEDVLNTRGLVGEHDRTVGHS